MLSTFPDLADIKACTGCGACAAACPTHSIQLIPNREGFSYPVIDSAACLRCGKCEGACPVLQDRKPDAATQVIAYAAYCKESSTRGKSSSGGIFSVLAEQIIKAGGVVCGAAWTPDLTVEHILISRLDELDRLRGSKYIQSSTWNCFPEIEKILRTGKKVLYSGTPCQVAALLSFLGRSWENLITVDLICHGTPSGLVWKKHLNDLEKRFGAEVCSACFRDKTSGWRNYSLSFACRNGKETKEPFRENDYMTAFLKNWSLRYSCYQCMFKGFRRVSDLTLGDLWGIEHILPEWDDDLGVSLIFVQSESGKRLLADVTDYMVMQEVDPELAVKRNSMVQQSVRLPAVREYFFRNLESKRFHKLVISCARRAKNAARIHKIKRIIKRIIKPNAFL